MSPDRSGRLPQPGPGEVLVRLAHLPLVFPEPLAAPRFTATRLGFGHRFACECGKSLVGGHPGSADPGREQRLDLRARQPVRPVTVPYRYSDRVRPLRPGWLTADA
ncbi:hypothetical protein [Streptomyces sp. NPDC086182]|uniref:hypothetical protein n=1 Tax=Streptomyces sp. NPDC086182 TaxID=3155058 RepID=UPI00342289C6